jgi:hypothetical protein
MTGKESLQRQIVNLMDRAEKVFAHDGAVYLPKTVVDTVESCWVSLLQNRDYDRTAHLLQVAELLIVRNRTKFAANPQAWIDRQREMAAA